MVPILKYVSCLFATRKRGKKKTFAGIDLCDGLSELLELARSLPLGEMPLFVIRRRCCVCTTSTLRHCHGVLASGRVPVSLKATLWAEDNSQAIR